MWCARATSRRETCRWRRGRSVNNNLYVNRLARALRPTAQLVPSKHAPVKDAAASPATSPSAKRSRDAAISDQLHGQELRIFRGEFHRHTEISATAANDGPLEDNVGLCHRCGRNGWLGCGDHDNGAGREYPWWLTQKDDRCVSCSQGLSIPCSRMSERAISEGIAMWSSPGVASAPCLACRSPIGITKCTADTQMLYKYCTVRWRLRLAHQRHQHGHRLA